MSVGDKIRAEACMNLFEREGINSLVDPVFGRLQKENDKSERPNHTHLNWNSSSRQHDNLANETTQSKTELRVYFMLMNDNFDLNRELTHMNSQ